MRKNFHLTISVIILIPVALAYGIGSHFDNVFKFEIVATDLKNIFKGLMFLYLALATLWIFGIINKKYWYLATLTNVLFMSGLAAGRIVSLVVDGRPSIGLLIGLILEIFLAFWGFYNLRKYETHKLVD